MKRGTNSKIAETLTSSQDVGLASVDFKSPSKSCSMMQRLQTYRMSTNSASPSKKSRIDNNVIALWKITNESEVIGCIVDGGYPASDLFLNSISKEQFQLLVPYEKNQSVLLCPALRGKLMTSFDAFNIVEGVLNPISTSQNKLTPEQVNRLKEKFPAIVSETGVSAGSKSVWVFTAYQGLDREPHETVDFEVDVYLPILNFFKKTKRTSDPNNNGKIILPETIDYAEKLFDLSPDWNVSIKTFDLDTIEKSDIFHKLCVSF